MKLLKTILILPLLLSSCMVGPNFTKPGNDLPASWATSKPPVSNPSNARDWWTIFGDPQLNTILGQALGNNPDMKVALIRVRESRSAAKIVGASLLPSSSASFGANRQSRGGLSDSASSDFALGADISWDLDVFGGNRRNVESALASLLSTEANAMAVRTLLLANVATTYFDWIAACEQLRVAEEQLVLQKETLQTVEDRFAVGLMASELDLQQAKSLVASTEANIPLIKASRDSSRNTLAALLGTYMSRTSLKIPSKSVFMKLPTIPVGLPSDLLRRRPDVIGAEADLHAAVADVGVAVSDLYPKFSLTGTVESGAKNFQDIFLNHSSGWRIGGGVLQPLYQGGRLREQVKLQEAAAERVAETYRKVLITAVGEVESALITYGSTMERLAKKEKENAANKKAFELSWELYSKGGMIEFINVVSAQQSWLSSEEALVTLRQTIRKSVVQLALALGGGW